VILGRHYPSSKAGEWRHAGRLASLGSDRREEQFSGRERSVWLGRSRFVLCSSHFPCGQPNFCLPALFPYLRSGDNCSALPAALGGCRALKFVSATRRVPGSRSWGPAARPWTWLRRSWTLCPLESAGSCCWELPLGAALPASEAVGVVGVGESRLSRPEVVPLAQRFVCRAVGLAGRQRPTHCPWSGPFCVGLGVAACPLAGGRGKFSLTSSGGGGERQNSSCRLEKSPPCPLGCGGSLGLERWSGSVVPGL